MKHARIARPAGSVWRAADLRDYAGPLLLDTHIWVWLLEGDSSRLPPAIVSLLDRSGAAAGLRVCDISAWEVAVQAAKGKLSFSIDPMLWLRRAERAPGVRTLPLDREILILSTRLAGTVQNDPADRMLIAAAQLSNIPLVTADELIIAYARATPGTPVVDATLS